MTLEFCTQETSRLDSAGRLKLSTAVQRDFQRHTDGDVVLYCVPEGAVGIYPPDYWPQIRGAAPNAPGGPPGGRNTLVQRRLMRRFGSSAQPGSISNQGRITIPPTFREYAGLEPGAELVVVGCEIGVELWNAERWEAEAAAIEAYFAKRGEVETQQDLAGGDEA